MQADTCNGDTEMKIVVIGGTGLIGRPLVNLLQAAGHEAVAASPSTGIKCADRRGTRRSIDRRDCGSRCQQRTFIRRRGRPRLLPRHYHQLGKNVTCGPWRKELVSFGNELEAD